MLMHPMLTDACKGGATQGLAVQDRRVLMHVAKILNRNARPSFLLRETYREDGKVKNRTLANLSKLPIERIETLRAALRSDPLVPIGSERFEIRRSLPHGQRRHRAARVQPGDRSP